MWILKLIKRKTIKGIIIILVVFLVFSYFYLYFENNKDHLKTHLIETKKIEEKVISLGELSSLQYNYKNMVHYEDCLDIRGYEIPFTQKSFFIMYEGYIKAGVNLKTVEIRLHDDNKISIALDSAEFTDHVIDENQIKIYDEKSGLFNKIILEDAFHVLAEEKKKTETQLKHEEFLEDANNQTIKLLTPVLKEMGFEDIQFHFK